MNDIILEWGIFEDVSIIILTLPRTVNTASLFLQMLKLTF